MQNVLAHYMSVHGRIDRGQWWMGHLLLLVALAVAFLPTLLLSVLSLLWEPIGFTVSVGVIVFVAAYIAYAWSSLALSIKRLRDAGYSPWLLVLWIVPLANLVVFLLIIFAPPTDAAGQGSSRCMRCGKPTVGAAALCSDCSAAAG